MLLDTSMTVKESWMAKAKKIRQVQALTIAFDATVRAALDKAAEDDMRPAGVLVQKVMIEWLKARGYLK
jgi:hypothetical protein